VAIGSPIGGLSLVVRWTRSWAGTTSAKRVVAGVVTSLAFAASAQAAPYIGVDTWYAYGPNVNEQTVVNLTDATVDRGLKAAGYKYVWIDAGWWKAANGPGTPGARNANGSIQLDATLWPHGMRWLTDYIHSKGLRAGIYTDAGPVGCGNGGSWEHYQQDADTFAAWGFDAVKMDYCGGGRTGMTPEQNFSAFSASLRATGRPMLLNICNVLHPSGGPGYWLTAWRFGARVSNAWRTGPDIGWPGVVSWSNVLRNLDLDASHPQAQSAGHYNDPDYIVPGASKTLGESRAQVTMWAMESAPLMVSADLEHLPSQLVALTTNRSVIAVDRTDVQARQVGRGVWTKPAPKGGVYVALLNRQGTVRKMTARSLHQGRHPVVRNVWTGRKSTSTHSNVTVTVPGNSAVLLQVTTH
jgi:alpha-galactosidase